MEILALYTSPENLSTALAAGARHLAATLQGLALVYRMESSGDEPDGWAGFAAAQDAGAAGRTLGDFLAQVKQSERPLRSAPPREPERIWARASGGIFGFPLRQSGRTRGVAIVGSPGPWPRMRNAEIESILRQITLVLDHHAVTEERIDADPADDLLRMSEQILAQDIALIEKDRRLGQIERLKSDLIEKMTYELRTPLNSIIERVISVLANEHENLSDSGRMSLRGALDDGNALLRTLQNILDLWRLKQNEVSIQNQTVNLAEVVEEAFFNVRDSLQPGVVLEKRIPSALPKIRTDLGKLNQILFHILDNAAKFTRLGKIELEVAIDNGQLHCTVSDSGIGIAQDDQAQIFEEFFQVDGSTDSAHRGAGLGLTLARGLVDLLGGTVSLSSEIGRGSRFAFSIPVSIC
jgi:signal transduction histidine kinase